MKNYKKILLLILIIAVFAVPVVSTFAQQTGRDLEIDYIDIPTDDVIVPEKTGIGIVNYVQYVFYFIMAIGGIAAFAMIVYAGFRWMTAGGRPAVIIDARDKIFSALVGLAILFGAFLILNTINTELITLKIPPIRPLITNIRSGVFFCQETVDIPSLWREVQSYKKRPVDNIKRVETDALKQKIANMNDEIEKRCYYVTQSSNIPKEFTSLVGATSKIKYIYYVPEIVLNSDGSVDIENSREYGSIIYDKIDFTGKSEVLIQPSYGTIAYMTTPSKDQNKDKNKRKPLINILSVKPFIITPKPPQNWGITLYEEADQNLRGVAAGHEKESFDFQDIFCEPSSPVDSSISSWWCSYNLTTQLIRSIQSDQPTRSTLLIGTTWSPLSYMAIGDIIIVLCKDDGVNYNPGECKTLTSTGLSYENNLLIYDGLYDIRDCESGETPAITIAVPSLYGGSVIYQCKKSAIKTMDIIAGSIF